MSKKHRPRPRVPQAPEAPAPWWRPVLLFLLLGGGSFAAAYGLSRWMNDRRPPGMAWIPGGTFVLGSEGPYAPRTEQPAHPVRLAGFWMDEAEVTNAQFARFVEATGHVTTAEKTPDWEELKKHLSPDEPRPPQDRLVPGSMVFTPPREPVSTEDAR